MRLLIAVVAVMTLSLTTSPSCAATPDGIGIVRSTVGDVSIVRNGQQLKAVPGFMLLQGDLVQTGDGKVGLILEDDTAIAMGRDSKLVLTRFMFQPKEKNFSFLLRLLHGTISFIAGRIAKLAPDAVHIETPAAAIGVRGSHVLVKVD